MKEKTCAQIWKENPKQCSLCKFYPDDCGYWKPGEQNESKANHIHNCPDYQFDLEKRLSRGSQGNLA